MRLSRLVCATLLAGSALALPAQTHYEGNFFVGAKGGVSVSRVQFNPSVKQKMPVGGVAGVTCRYIEENHFGIIAELNFEQRGWKEDFGEDSPYSYTRTLNYLQLPVLAHIYFGSPRAHFFVNAGPEIGLLLGDGTSANFDPARIEELPDFPLKNRQVAQLTLDATGTVDFGISAGLGAEYFIDSRHSLNLEARFYYGLGNVLKCGRTEPFSGANSMSVMVTLGYSFRVR